MMQIRLLGPIDLAVDDRVQPIPGLRRKALLAALSLQPGALMTSDRLIDLVWDDLPPPGAHRTLHSHVSQLRRFLADGAIIRSAPPGYVLDLPSEGTDVAVMERLIREGTATEDPALAAAILKRALALPRGRPLADLVGWRWFDEQADRLTGLEQRASLALIEHRLALGDHAALIIDLQAQIAERPLEEELHRLLMLALYRSGRQAESLSTYRRLREQLVVELGIEPCRELRELHEAVLAQDPSLAWAPAAGSRPATTTAASPRLMWRVPPRNPHFVGRETLLQDLHRRMTASGRSVTVEALFGLGGVGKTQLAIEYAHRYAADHWLVCWIDAEHPALIGAQLAALASELGLPAAGPVIDATDAVLAELRARSGWLLVLDNAQRAEDVVAVLPTAGMGHVLVTSRHRGWGGIGGRTEVDVLTRAETTRLLRRRLPELDEDLADSLAEELGDLPLAAAQAAGYLEATAIPPATYLRRFRTRRHTLLDRGHVIGYHGTLDTAWTLSLDRLRQEAPAAVRLLHVAAFLAPEPIPLRWFTGHQQALQGPLGGATADPYDLDEVVGSIVGYSLGRRVGDQLQIHRLVQAAIRHRLPDTVRRQVENHAWAILIDASRVEPLSPRNRNHRAPTTTREGCRRGHIRPSQPPPGVSTAGAKSGRHNPRVTPPSGARSDRPGGARSR